MPHVLSSIPVQSYTSIVIETIAHCALDLSTSIETQGKKRKRIH